MMSNTDKLRVMAKEFERMADDIDQFTASPSMEQAAAVLDARAFEAAVKWAGKGDPPCEYDEGCPFDTTTDELCDERSHNGECYRELWRKGVRGGATPASLEPVI